MKPSNNIIKRKYGPHQITGYKQGDNPIRKLEMKNVAKIEGFKHIELIDLEFSDSLPE